MKLNVVVLGLGTFGSQAAVSLSEGDANVLAVDIDERAVERISSQVTRAMCADATNEEAMEAAGALEVDTAVVALRRHFATAVLAVYMLRKHGVERIFAHVGTEQEGEAIRAVGATDIVFPEHDMADRVAQKLLTPDLADLIPLDRNVVIVEMPCPQSFVGKSPADLDIRRKYGVTIIAVRSAPPEPGASGEINVAPASDVTLEHGDIIYLIGEVEQLDAFKQAVNPAQGE